MNQQKTEGLVKEFKRVLLSCMEMNNSTKGLLYVQDLKTGDYRLAAYYGYLKRNPRIELYELGHPMIGVLKMKRKAFLINDIANYPDLESNFHDQGIHNAQITPIYMNERYIAFIEERNRAGNQPYDEETLKNTARVAEETKELLQLFFGDESKKKKGGAEEEVGRSYKYFLVKFSSFRRYLPVISGHFQDAVSFLKPSVAFDAIVLNVIIGEKSLNFIYSIRPLSEDSKRALSDSLAEFFPFLGSGDNISSHFFAEKMTDETFEGRAETYYTMNVLERDGFAAYLSAIRFTPKYFEGEEVAALSRFARLLSMFLGQVIREYRCSETYIGLILNLLELSKSSGYNFRLHALKL